VIAKKLLFRKKERSKCWNAA